MDPANRSETSAMTLSRVEQNDPTLTELRVSSIPYSFNPAGSIGYYWPEDSANLARLGVAIGANTNLQELIICGAHELADMAANNGAFFEGLKRSTSICDLRLENCDLSGGMGRDILNEFVAKNINLTAIVLNRCAIGNGGTGVLLASAVSSCTKVTSIRISSCNIDDDILVEFVSVTRGLHQLRSLNLSWNNFGRAGCEALATMLRNPNGNLFSLYLDSNNRIDDNCATILANSLKVNRKLRRLNLSSNNAITGSGWDAFSQVLCNTSSVNDTYLSNHTLTNLDNANLPNNLRALLELNRGAITKQVAIQKILRHHTLDMEPFLEWDLKVLPFVVVWFDRARDSVPENSGAHIDTKQLSAIYQFAKALPMMFVPSHNKVSAKRKIRTINWAMLAEQGRKGQRK